MRCFHTGLSFLVLRSLPVTTPFTTTRLIVCEVGAEAPCSPHTRFITSGGRHTSG